MRISSVEVKKFRRFTDLEIIDIPEAAKLVVLAGPNGSGKSSLFDAFLLFYRVGCSFGWNNDRSYYDRSEENDLDPYGRVKVNTHGDVPLGRGAVYVRSAYRHDPEFMTNQLSQQGEILDSMRLTRLVEPDPTVGGNYQRMAAQAMEDLFVNECDETTIGEYRDKLIGECRDPLKRIFPDLTFIGVGNPLINGTFQFEKGASKKFDYKNLSGGEKAAFDLILDLVVKRDSYDDAIYCIDEPELHMNTKLQGALLEELLGLLPGQSQLWIGSHSIGMMRKARELYDADPSSVVFLDFGDHDFDQYVVMKPSNPSRAFWENQMHVALDDLASLVAPRQVVICEGNPGGAVPGKNAEFDSSIYETIFSGEFPDVKFLSAGSSKKIVDDFLGLAAALPKIVSGVQIIRLIDRDDHARVDVETFKNEGITVLSRRHIEAYVYDDEVLAALCHSVKKATEVKNVIEAKKKALADSARRGNPVDDYKSAAGAIYTETKRILSLVQVGNDQRSFARNTLAPLITPETAVYKALKDDIFCK